MKLLCPCPACGTQFRVDEKFAGRKTRCPACDAELVVPQVPAVEMAEMVDEPKAPVKSAPKAASATAAGRPAGAPSRAAAGASAAAGRPQPQQKLPVAAPVARKVVAKAAAPAEPAEEDLFSSFVNEPASPRSSAASAGSLSSYRKPKKKSPWENPATLITAGVIVLAVVAVGVYMATRPGDEGTIAAKVQPKVEAPKPPSLVLDLSPQERSEVVWLVVDGVQKAAPPNETGPIEFANMTPGNHTVTVHRMTGGNWDITYDPQKNPGRYLVKPDWGGSGQGSVVASSAGAGQSGGLATGMSQWQTDPEKAKFQASHEKKDLFIALFTTDEHADWCAKMKSDVFSKKEFVDFAAQHFVPLLLECGKTPLEGSAMAKLAAEYHVTSFPAVLYADDQGQVLLWDADFHARTLFETLNWVNGSRADRDREFAAAEKGSDSERLTAAGKAMKWLGEKNLAQFYSSKIHDWKTLAEKVDPKDEQGQLEVFMLGELEARLQELPKNDGKKIAEAMKPYLTWIKDGHKFKDPDAAARFGLKVSEILGNKEGAKDLQDAIAFILAADDCHPKNDDLRKKLAVVKELFTSPFANGTGWVCAEGGYIMTNNHVVEPEESMGMSTANIWVTIGGKDYPCDVVAHGDTKENDLALIKLRDPKPAAGLKPLILRPGLARSAQAVAAMGFPLADRTGTELKFTQGAISAMPSKERFHMYLLDLTINPGNSGGPLLDTAGRVLGLNTRKSGGGEEDGKSISSYGLAIPADRAIKFLKENLKTYKVPEVGPPAPKDPHWDDVYEKWSPSVVIVYQKFI